MYETVALSIANFKRPGKLQAGIAVSLFSTVNIVIKRPDVPFEAQC